MGGVSWTVHREGKSAGVQQPQMFELPVLGKARVCQQECVNIESFSFGHIPQSIHVTADDRFFLMTSASTE